MRDLRSKWLTKGGWVSALLLAGLIVCSFGPLYLIYPLLFLIIGSFLSKLNKGSLEFDDSAGRTAMQVFANGGVGMLCCALSLLLLQPALDILFILSFSVALSDTASSEIGRYFKGETYDLVTFKKVRSGLSGGVSIVGTAGGLVGGLILPLIAYLSISISIKSVILLWTLSFAGMLIDSILGSTIQAKYSHNDEIREVGSKAQLTKGIHGIDNNLVNFISIFITALAYALIF